jgi:hypothetical protein
MAKFQPGPIVNEIRGSTGGLTFFRNRGGQVVRTRVTPTNPSSAAQVAIRARLKSATQAWSGTATATQRAGWNELADRWNKKNSLGAHKHMNGFSLFTSSNILRLICTGSLGASVPTNLYTPTLIRVTIAPHVSTTSLTFQRAVPAGTGSGYWLVEVGAPLTPGHGSPTNTWLQIAVQSLGTNPTANVWATYVARFGSPTIGQKTFWRATPTLSANFIAGPRLTGSFLWVA